MLYSGHFSFDEIGHDLSPRHGYFACLVKAGNAEKAVEKFKNRIIQIKENEMDELFGRIIAVYIEDVVEIPDNFSDDAVVTRYQSSEGPFPKSKSCFLPITDNTKLKSYEWVPDKGDNIKDKDGYREEEPFLRFDA